MAAGFLVAVFMLAVARLTGLVTVDQITDSARVFVLRRLDHERPVHRGIGYLITCQWCASIWIGAACAPIAWWWGTHPSVAIPALALAASQVTGMLSQVGR